MTVQRLPPLILSDDERAELKSLTMRRKTAQGLALRARIVLTCAESGHNKEVAKLGRKCLAGPLLRDLDSYAKKPPAWTEV